jgi:hypothetical protein
MTRHVPHNPKVAGSNPAPATNKIKELQEANPGTVWRLCGKCALKRHSAWLNKPTLLTARRELSSRLARRIVRRRRARTCAPATRQLINQRLARGMLPSARAASTAGVRMSTLSLECHRGRIPRRPSGFYPVGQQVTRFSNLPSTSHCRDRPHLVPAERGGAVGPGPDSRPRPPALRIADSHSAEWGLRQGSESKSCERLRKEKPCQRPLFYGPPAGATTRDRSKARAM